MAADLRIYLIIDGSGSMSGQKQEVVTGVNEFIDDQKNEAQSNNDDIRFSLTTFDDKVMEIYDGEDIGLVNPVTVADTFLGGSTALFDAIGRTLTNAEDVDSDRNLVVIYTDGYENASREFTREQIKDLIERLDATGDWQFIYLGAEFADFAKEAAAIGAYASINTSKARGSVPQTLSKLSQTATSYKEMDSSDVVAVAASGGLVNYTNEQGIVDWNAVEVKEPDIEKVPDPED